MFPFYKCFILHFFCSVDIKPNWEIDHNFVDGFFTEVFVYASLVNLLVVYIFVSGTIKMNEERPNPCIKSAHPKQDETCPSKKQPRNLAQLKLKEATHDNIDKPYACSHCGQTFKELSKLGTHYRIHTGEKPYSCSNCGKAFSDNGNLKKHQILHSKEKP